MKTFRICILLLGLGCLALSAAFVGGCSKSLEGTTDENQKPRVWFVNVPPENSRSSVNPIVNWYGQDIDGQIDYYRYIVVREDEIGYALGRADTWNPVESPLDSADIVNYVSDHLGNVHDTMWTVLLVRADSTDPHTSNIIPMSAEMEDPVRSFVPQFVFVQAYDEEGLGSDIVFRRFLRNDNPPGTRIVGFIEDVPFINSVLPSGPATGIRLRWEGSDVIDYPTDAPPFEFQWKLFGPYSDEEYDEILGNFRATVFVTNDARVFRYDDPADSIGVDSFYTVDSSQTPWDSVLDSTSTRWLPPSLIICDTTYEGGNLSETCDTFPIVEFEGSNIYGTVDTLLEVFEGEFQTGQFASTGRDYYRIADSSHDAFGNIWITEMRDTIYNAYWNAPADTTQAGTFIFAVRSRDDARVPDLTPAWRGFTVINPQHERDILVVNWSSSAHENKAREASMVDYWDETINTWVEQTGRDGDVDFDPVIDIKDVAPYVTDNKMLELILRYKVAIMVQDAAVAGTWSGQGMPVDNTITALQTGVNVWVAMRVPLGNYGFLASPGVSRASAAYQYFFGVEQTTFPGWGSFLYAYWDTYGFGRPRTEHFIGTLTLDADRWPELAVDTALLRTRYDWQGSLDPVEFPFYPYYAPLGAIPQVGWCVRTFDTEAMYLYNSFYGNEHGLFSNLSYHGRPVGVRLNRGLFRTVHFMFTPLSIEAEAGQTMVNGVMDWLYDGRTEFSASAGKRSSQQAALSDDLENRYWQCYWNANGDRETFYELLRDAY